MQHGTSQIETVVDEIKHLRKEIGSGSESETQEGEVAPAGNLASDVKKLLDEQAARATETASLDASIKALAAIVREDIRRSSEVHGGLSAFSCFKTVLVTGLMRISPALESIVGMVDRQRQDQERMLRTVAEGVSVLVTQVYATHNGA